MAEAMCEICGVRPSEGTLQLMDEATGEYDDGIGPCVCSVCAEELIEDGEAEEEPDDGSTY